MKLGSLSHKTNNKKYLQYAIIVLITSAILIAPSESIFATSGTNASINTSFIYLNALSAAPANPGDDIAILAFTQVTSNLPSINYTVQINATNGLVFVPSTADPLAHPNGVSSTECQATPTSLGTTVNCTYTGQNPSSQNTPQVIFTVGGSSTSYNIGIITSDPNTIVDYSGDYLGSPVVIPCPTCNLSTITTTTTTLSSLPNPSTFGQPVTFTATVSPTPTTGSTVTFFDGVTLLGTGTTDVTGHATLSVSSLSVGSHTITAKFVGSTIFAPSTSVVLTQTINNMVVGGKVNGGGSIGEKTHFDFEVKADEDKHIQGHLGYTDTSAKINIQSNLMNALSTDPNLTRSTFSGTAQLNEKSGYTFTVYIEDNAEPGKNKDVFSIKIYDSHNNLVYSKQGKLTDGNIQIHKAENNNDHNNNNNDHNNNN